MGGPQEKGERRPSKTKFGNLSFKRLRKSESSSLPGPDSISSNNCIICVGSTGTGKSSTIARYTGNSVRSGGGTDAVTEHCQLWPDINHGETENPVWVDTVGWEDRHSDDIDTFQETLRFLSNKSLTRVSAIVWCVQPNIRQDATMQRQAQFIDQFAHKTIWDNVIIICKQAVNPTHDAAGALRAAQEFNPTSTAKVVGYRYLDDPSFSPEQQAALQTSEDTRKLFNVLTNDELVGLVRKCVQDLPPPVQVVFVDQKCLDCYEEGDRRLMSQYCHMQKTRKHPGKLKRVHPGGPEVYHLAGDQTGIHPGQLASPWYQIGCVSGGERWSCCKKTAGAQGCRQVWTCCRKDFKDEGCRKRYSCCKKPTDFGSGGGGCEMIYTCCDEGQGSEGCKDVCLKCGKKWGTAADKCFKKDHENMIEL
eukprot:TRINITY_DN10814_c0_g1_i2.p1 TRINITY_DN10814_c0_g1~~TRINITY_DN10814_c0_g1_i2.p1  ORF type:complete len:420 (-),score=100.19 TRINITY_DN10814_c0_g1_i2:746-2005(-)